MEAFSSVERRPVRRGTAVQRAAGTAQDGGKNLGRNRSADERADWLGSLPFLALHLSPLVALWTGVTPFAITLGVALFVIRMFFITAGYHRYFSHRSFRTGRAMQFLLGLGGTLALQKGPLWWAGHHRSHHRHADRSEDVHSPLRGFYWSHIGWILCRKYETTPFHLVPDFARYPELRLLNRYHYIPPLALAGLCYAAGGWSALVLGFGASTVALYHCTFAINSLAHVIGRRPYATKDRSGNSLLLALLTLGEGWHNNHHHCPSSARQGFRWWQIDGSYYVLKAMSWLGLVWDLRPPLGQT